MAHQLHQRLILGKVITFVVVLLVTSSHISSTAAQSSNVLNLVTYNTALAFAEATRVPRLKIIEERLRSGNFSAVADILCLQEVQEEVHQENLTAAAREGGFPYRASFLDGQDSSTLAALAVQPPCNVLKLLSFAGCLQANCTAEVASGNIRSALFCTYTRCGSQVRAASLSQECINCLNALGFSGIAENSRPDRLGRGLCFLNRTRLDFRPTYGLLLLSKYPLSNVARQTFLQESSLFSRGYLRATVAGGSRLGGDWTVTCSHLYPSVAGVPYTGVYGSAEEENLNNTLAMMTDSVVAASSQVALMGDMNHGPEVSATMVTGEFPNNYQAVLSRSFCSPYAGVAPRLCSFCRRSNPILVAQNATATDQILDHIYLKAPFLSCTNGIDSGGSLSAARLFTDIPPPLSFPLSDHYGVQVSINITETPSAGTSTVPSVATTSAGTGAVPSVVSLALGLLLVATVRL